MVVATVVGGCVVTTVVDFGVPVVVIRMVGLLVGTFTLMRGFCSCTARDLSGEIVLPETS